MLLLILIYTLLCLIKNVHSNEDATNNITRVFRGHIKHNSNARAMVGVISENLLCSGFLIDSSWVLTAAHCIRNIELAVVLGGSLDIKGPEAVVRESAEVIIHPEYQKKAAVLAGHDIALIKLDPPLTEKGDIQPIELTGEPWPLNDDTYQASCIFMGFGSEDTYSADPLFHVDQVEAEHGYKACGGCAIEAQYERLVCLKRANNVGICGSDFGGPLVCENQAVGLAHKIYNLSDCMDTDVEQTVECRSKDTVSAFLYICPYLTWINHYVNTTPSECRDRSHTMSSNGCNNDLISPSNTLILLVFLFYLYLVLK